MPTARVQRSLAIDGSFFQEAVNAYVAGRATVENPTIQDYIEHYGGTTRGVAEKLVDAGEYTNIKSAMRQVQRMLKNPDLKLKPSTIQKLGKLQVSPAKITVTGWYTYDGGNTWKHDKFSHAFSSSQTRSIISATRQEGNQAGLDTFMDLYGVGVYLEFAEGVSINIEPVS